MVVGAGHNGLVAANLLADAGQRVVVVEANGVAGGAVRSDTSLRADFVTDLFSAFYPLAAVSPVLRDLRLDQWGLRWAHAPVVLAHVFPDDRCAVLSRDVDVTAQSLDHFGAGDGDRWREMVADFLRLRDPLFESIFRPFPPVRGGLTLLRRLGLADAVRFARFVTLPVRRFAEENFRGEGAALLLAGNALHTDLPPENAGSAIYSWLLCMLAQTVGFPAPVGGSGKITEALVARLHASGGELRLSSPVERIIVGHGHAIGVRLRGGERITARSVLADVTAPALYRELVGVDLLPHRLRSDLDAFQWDASTLKVNWALSAPISWTAAAARTAGTLHLGVDMDGLTDFAASLATRRISQRPFLLLGQMTTTDPRRSPNGTESAWAYTHLPAGRDLSQDEVDEHVRLVEAIIEAHAPGFGALILARSVQSPAGLQATDANLVSGAVGGGTSGLHQQLVFRPVPGLARAETPIDGLYLASASAHPGGGVHGAPGANAARAALARTGVLGGVRRRGLDMMMNRLYRG